MKGSSLGLLLVPVLLGCDAHPVVAPSHPTLVDAAAPPVACVLSARRIEPQALKQLRGFTGGPSVFVNRDPETDETARAVVRLGPDHVAHVEVLPGAFSDTVAITASHTILFRFSVEKQVESLVVLPREGTAILGELEGVSANELLDAVDGTEGSSILSIHKGPAVGLVRIDRDGHATLPTAALTEQAAGRVGLSRDTRGTVQVGWIETSDDRSASSLWVVRASEEGRALGPPVRIDTAPGEQPVADVVIAPSANGPVVAWNPILSKSEAADSHDVVLGVALRVFRLGADGVATKIREQPLTSHAGPIASVGGYVLSNHLQALPIRSDVVLSWSDEGVLFASGVDSWKPVDLGRSSKDGDAKLIGLSASELALVATESTFVDAGVWWPTLQTVVLGCGSSRAL